MDRRPCVERVLSRSSVLSNQPVPTDRRQEAFYPGSNRPRYRQNSPSPGFTSYRGNVNYRTEIRDFLTTRRARLTPEQAGVPAYSGVRRVPGLRREEVAHLAGVSVDYYTRLERGNLKGVSPEVLESVVRALQLDDVEREHLFDLVEATRPRTTTASRPRRTTRERIDPGVQTVLDSMNTPALVQNARLDVLSTNHLARAVHPFLEEFGTTPFNFARFLFLDPRAPEFYIDWDLAARNNAALLRAATAKDPDDDALIQLVGQLSTQSGEFRDLWASHNVLKYRNCAKRYRHPLVGNLTFGSQQFQLSADPALIMLVYTVEAASPTHDALQLLASWTTPITPARQPTDSDLRDSIENAELAVPEKEGKLGKRVE